MDAIAILTGGGPAPGMNTVVGSVAKTFLEKGYRVLGLHWRIFEPVYEESAYYGDRFPVGGRDFQPGRDRS